MNRLVRTVLLLLLSVSSAAFAQNLGTGLYAFGSFDSKGFDSINLGNLNTHFEIPVVSKPGRGMNFTYSIVYDGLVWTPSGSSGTGSWLADPSWGFHGSLLGGAYTGYVTFNQLTLSCPESGVSKPPPGYTTSVYVYHDAFGKNHAFNYRTSFCPSKGTTITGNGLAFDGSGLQFGGSQLASNITDGLVHARNGATISLPVGASLSPTSAASTISDLNGNVITNNGAGTFTDTLGVAQLKIAGSSMPASPLTLTYPTTTQAGGSTSATVAVAYKTYTVQTNFGCSGITEFGATSTNLVDHITLGDGSSTYTFTYEATPGTTTGAVTGRLASITLPTGGTIRYSYSVVAAAAEASIPMAQPAA